jgi:hypothetical protein
VKVAFWFGVEPVTVPPVKVTVGARPVTVIVSLPEPVE